MIITRAFILCPVLIAFITPACFVQTLAKEDNFHWRTLAGDDIQEIIKINRNEGKAKNVIIFIGDGMGPNTVTAARIHGVGESGYLAFERFPYTGVLKTYSANKLVPDSSSTATALFCGVKANQKTSGVDATVPQGDCEASLNKEARVKSIMSWAQDAGKATGFVTTTRVTHATPSALYAHVPDRGWECEANIPVGSENCKDIARQLVEDEPGRNLNVIMGGGRQCLQANVIGSDADPVDTWSCYSKADGRDLIADWNTDKRNRGLSHVVVVNTGQLNSLNASAVDYVFGVFANGHLKMEHQRDKSLEGMPSLRNMTEKAIEILQRDPDGYVLVVEGGMIDFAHHRGHARQALEETAAFSDAIGRTIELTKDNELETLIIVTSDHSHSLVFAGYADRGTSVLGVAQASKMNDVNYTSLLYGTGGPDNYQYTVIDGEVVRPAPENTEDYNYAQQAGVLTDEVTHSGTDVVVYATGPRAYLLTSTHEQTYVAYVAAYAAEIGPFYKSAAGAKGSVYVFILLTGASLFSNFGHDLFSHL